MSPTSNFFINTLTLLLTILFFPIVTIPLLLCGGLGLGLTALLERKGTKNDNLS